MFYAQSTGAVISGRTRKGKRHVDFRLDMLSQLCKGSSVRHCDGPQAVSQAWVTHNWTVSRFQKELQCVWKGKEAEWQGLRGEDCLGVSSAACPVWLQEWTVHGIQCSVKNWEALGFCGSFLSACTIEFFSVFSRTEYVCMKTIVTKYVQH